MLLDQTVNKNFQERSKQPAPTRCSIVTFTTDFSTRDWFAGTVHGIIASISPATSVIPVTHDIPPQDIRAAAFVLGAACAYFPPGTIHVAIVDPGVGSTRKAIAVKTVRYIFLGPDNGILSWALRNEEAFEIRELSNHKLFLQHPSHTFHGRDIFAPVAAHLAKGMKFSQIGPVLRSYAELPWPEPKRYGSQIRGEIIYFDHYGNAITNIPAELTPDNAIITLKGRRVPLVQSYASVPQGKLLAIIGSHNYLEIAINTGSAQNELRLLIGNEIDLRSTRTKSPDMNRPS
jgi:S-adenosyl-L-methionine hydrolase (adenosine-forming)